MCIPRFDSPACFAALLGDESNGRWLLAPAGDVRHVERRYRDDTLVLETDFHTDGGVLQVVDSMPIRDEAPDVVRVARCLEGRVHVRMELVLRFDYGHVVPWVRREPDGGLTAVAGPDAVHLIPGRPTRGRDLTTVAEFELDAGDEVPFVLTWFPSHEPAPLAVDGLSATEDTTAWWREWSARSRADGPRSRPRAAQPDHAQGAHLRADGRHRRRADHLAARGDRRRAQLGLPLLLGARRDAHAPGADPRGLPRRGGRLARLAAARRGRLARPSCRSCTGRRASGG